jgi:hypothetical protein
MSVAVVPSLLMAVARVGRDQPVEQLRPAVRQARFKLDRAERGGAADHGEMSHTGRDARSRDQFTSLVGQVVDVAMPLRPPQDLILPRRWPTRGLPPDRRRDSL